MRLAICALLTFFLTSCRTPDSTNKSSDVTSADPITLSCHSNSDTFSKDISITLTGQTLGIRSELGTCQTARDANYPNRRVPAKYQSFFRYKASPDARAICSSVFYTGPATDALFLNIRIESKALTGQKSKLLASFQGHDAQDLVGYTCQVSDSGNQQENIVANDRKICQSAAVAAVKAFIKQNPNSVGQYKSKAFSTDAGGVYQEDPSTITVTIADAQDDYAGYDLYDVKLQIERSDCKAASVTHVDSAN